MRCPHCLSLMENYRNDATERSRVRFYRCTLCQKEHVSSETLTVHRFAGNSQGARNVSPTPSHISARP